LLAKANEAAVAYKEGYQLFDRYRFSEAIPHFQQAQAAVLLPEQRGLLN
jgi:hypothetical protein